MRRLLAAEALGTLLLLTAIAGSGIMAQRLTADGALALLAAALATSAALFVLITLFAPLSGAQFNPALTLVLALRREMPAARAIAVILAQIAGAVLGVVLAHAMFELPLVQMSSSLRSGPGLWLSEGVASFGLVLTILGTRHAGGNVAASAALYVAAAYWFTASTGFANPAVTLARMLTDSASGISPADAPAFVIAQIAGALLAMAVFGWLWRRV